MTREQERLVALGAVFQAAVLVDRIATTGSAPPASINALLDTLLVRNPENTLAVYGGDDINLLEGYRALSNILERASSPLQREPLRYALGMLTLERRLSKNSDMLNTVGQRLQQIENQVQHFGQGHENVIASCGGLYQDTISTFSQRIQVHGEMRFLQQPDNAAKIRALLLCGIRSALLWHQLGGRRWQLIFARKRYSTLLQQRLSRH